MSNPTVLSAMEVVDEVANMRLNLIFQHRDGDIGKTAFVARISLRSALPVLKHCKMLNCDWPEGIPPFYFTGVLDVSAALASDDLAPDLRAVLINFVAASESPMTIVLFHRPADASYAAWYNLGNFLGAGMPELPADPNNPGVACLSLSHGLEKHLSFHANFMEILSLALANSHSQSQGLEETFRSTPDL